MRCFVTGATGFIGEHVVDRLVKKRCAVTALIVPGTLNDLTHVGHVRPVQGTLNDRRALAQATKNIDIVFHLAGRVWGKSVSDLRTVNVDGTANLLDACLDNGVRRFVFVSSASVYAPPLHLRELPLTETARLGPTENSPFHDYGVSKMDAEALVLQCNRNHGLEYTILRPTTTYGTGKGAHPAAQEAFLTRLIERPYLNVTQPGSRIAMQWVHVFDLAKAICHAGAFPRAKNQIFTIAGSETFDATTLRALVLDMANARPSADRFRRSRLRKPFEFLFDISKAGEMLNYLPGIDLHTGISQMLRHM
jgi:nucleoside-diphosphate-sugar epimerase